MIRVLHKRELLVNHTGVTVAALAGKKHLAVFGSTDSESSDDSLVDLAVGLGARFIKLGGLSRGERMTKYNRLLAIEEELIQSGAWGMCSSSALFSQEL